MPKLWVSSTRSLGGSLWQPIVWVLFTHSMGNIVPILWVNPESPSVPIVWVSERAHSMGDSQVTHTMGHGFTHSMGDPCRDSKSPIVWVVVGTHSMGGWPYYGDLASACQWQSLHSSFADLNIDPRATPTGWKFNIGCAHLVSVAKVRIRTGNVTKVRDERIAACRRRWAARVKLGPLA